MSMLFLEYPKCTTCKKAKKWLNDHGAKFEDRDIKEKNPTAEELKTWYQKSGHAVKGSAAGYVGGGAACPSGVGWYACQASAAYQRGYCAGRF